MDSAINNSVIDLNATNERGSFSINNSKTTPTQKSGVILELKFSRYRRRPVVKLNFGTAVVVTRNAVYAVFWNSTSTNGETSQGVDFYGNRVFLHHGDS
jgi:hypothetical protein